MTVGEDKIYHPIQQDWVTFLRTGEEIDGGHLLIEIELAPHGGNVLHRHRTFTETFEPVEGELHVERDGQDLVLRPGDAASVPPGVAHRFYSQSDQPIRFRVELRPPGQFEQVLRVGYGLARDGKVTKQGIPRSPLQAALLFVMGDTYVAAAPIWLQRVVAVPLAALARRLGVERSFEPYTRVEPPQAPLS